MVFRSIRGIGLPGTLALMRIRIEALFGGGSGKIYKVRVAGLAQPVLIRGGKSSDATVLYQIFAVKEYARATDLESVKFIVDAGANIGLASLYFLRAHPGAKIMVMEPDPGNFELCRKNLEPYKDQVVFFQGAMWSSCCRLALVPSPAEWGLGVAPAKPGQEAPIQAFDLLSLMTAVGEPSIDFLKLDVEGSEAEIFAAGAPPWLENVHNIAIEYHGSECERRFLKAMEGFEYGRYQRPMMEFFLDIHRPATDDSLPVPPHR